ncbi:SgcJ/EcaC family oxidoreductase [Sphingobacterium yanglingense]|uniref:Uncharacterized protein (TIGR02246 family) n=1 Tax=Sphingobacterium yanglingense TaxID=1437280 RepID=A0A4R6WHX4_9SPHI|nr:SgcJ/EcaC family oxidoreductase [Sphingobacterium yanglingense]TDQ79840.1 uncharacterized protein (TIGR02246 family) [Sphingobacterium yanglingense]
MIAPIVTKPEDIPVLFVEAWNLRCADYIADLFEENADFVNVVGIWWDNREAIRKAHDYGLTVIFKDSLLKLGKVKVKHLSEDIAVVHARMQLSGQSDLHGKAGTRNNMFLFVARKHPKGWLCVSAQNTDIVIGAETHIKREDGTLQAVDYRDRKN